MSIERALGYKTCFLQTWVWRCTQHQSRSNIDLNRENIITVIWKKHVGLRENYKIFQRQKLWKRYLSTHSSRLSRAKKTCSYDMNGLVIKRVCYQNEVRSVPFVHSDKLVKPFCFHNKIFHKMTEGYWFTLKTMQSHLQNTLL